MIVLIFIANTLAHLYNNGDGDSSASSCPAPAASSSASSRRPSTYGACSPSNWPSTHLAPLSIFADVVDTGAMGVVMVEDVALYLQRQPPLQAFGGLSVVFYGLGVAVYAFEGIGMVLPLESEAANKAGFGRTLGISMALISLMYALFGVLGYFAFGDDTRDIITTNLGKGVLTELVQVLPDLSVDATQLYMVSVAVALQEIGYDIHIEMLKEGGILLRGDLVDPTSGHLYQMLKRVGQLFGLLKSSLEDSNDECIILRALLQDKVSKVIKVLSESHWTSSFIVTMKKFQSICKESDGSAIILSYLIQCKKAHYLSIRKSDFVEGVKVSLVAAPVSNLLSLDFDMLHLIWTIEKLQQQLDMIDQRWDMKRKLALSSLKCGKKQVAYMYLRQAKLLSEGRGKCALLLDRVEEVFSTITHSESTKKVAEAIQIGAQAIKDNQISVEEVRSCLEELDESVASQKQVDEALGSLSFNDDIEDEDIEEDFKKLELELKCEIHEEGAPEGPEPVRVVSSDETTWKQESTDLLTDSLSSLRLEAA